MNSRKPKAGGRQRNVAIEILSALADLPRGATIRKLSEDINRDVTAVHEQIERLEEARLVDCARFIRAPGHPGVYRLHPRLRDPKP
jgi:DNA-binding IclR family transcriptional regulator